MHSGALHNISSRLEATCRIQHQKEGCWISSILPGAHRIGSVALAMAGPTHPRSSKQSFRSYCCTAIPRRDISSPCLRSSDNPNHPIRRTSLHAKEILSTSPISIPKGLMLTHLVVIVIYTGFPSQYKNRPQNRNPRQSDRKNAIALPKSHKNKKKKKKKS
jgi:hypothetical protein